MASENNDPKWLLSEKNLSDTMTAFYNAVIGVGKNAQILQTDGPWDIDPAEYEGSAITKEGMKRICGFLELLKNFTNDEATFNEQFFTPFQLAAKMLDDLRNLTNTPRSTDLQGWVFSVSKPTVTSWHGEAKTTVSAVIPQLQTVMSISVSEKSIKKTSSNYLEFTKCQPVSLVNRIHQVSNSTITNTNKPVLLSEFNFLFVSFEDIGLIGSSIEMENFCEIESIQSKGKQHMGFSFVSFAKVIDVQKGIMYLQGLNARQPTAVPFTISKHYYENAKMVHPKEMIGKHVRFFGVKWYSSDTAAADTNAKNAEVFLVQEGDENRLRIEDAMGMIRLRSMVSQKDAEKMLGIGITEKYINIYNNLAHFKYSRSSDIICNKFLETVTTIRNLRAKFKASSPRITREQLIDSEKLSCYSCISFVKKSRELYEILIDYQMQIDQYGTYDHEISFSKLPYSTEILKRKIWHLKYLGIFEFVKNDEQITTVGKKILDWCMKEDLDRLQPSSQKIIDVERISANGIPPSVFLRYLKDGNLADFSPLALDKNRTNLYWARVGTDEDTIKSKTLKYQTKRNTILDIMRSVRHSLTPQSIFEELAKRGEKIGCFTVNVILSETEKTGRIKKDGESWKYTTHSRMYDLFQTYPEKIFNANMICAELAIPLLEISTVNQYLKDYENAGKILPLDNGWISAVNTAKKIDKIISTLIKENVLRILKTRALQSLKTGTVKDRYMSSVSDSQAGVDDVVGEITTVIHASGFLRAIEKVGIEPTHLVRDKINDMINDNTIVISDGMLSLNN